MKSASKREPIFSHIAAGRFLLFSIVFFLSVPLRPSPGGAATLLSDMARLEASGESTFEGTRSLFRGYMSLGLLPEAASLLERRVRLGTFPARAAGPLFEEVVAGQAMFDDPVRLVSVCEAAIRGGVRTPAVLYHYGTALRRIPGRGGDASGILAQVGGEDPYRLLALYSLGQIAAERGETRTAADLFRRVEEGAGGVGQGGSLAARAARSRAEILLATGKGDESAQIFRALRRKVVNPLDRIGFAAAGDDPVRDLERLPPEMIAGLPLEDRVRFLLFLGGIADNAGLHETAVDRLDRAARELDDALSLQSPPSSEPPGRSVEVESLRIQLEGLRTLRQDLVYREFLPDDAMRAAVAELLVGLLCADRTAALAAPEAKTSAGMRLLSPGEVEEIVRRIEEVSLDGIEVDRLVERMSATLDTLQNMGHPINRYRRLVRLEKSQKEIHLLRERIRERRAATVYAVETGRNDDLPGLLKDVGSFLNELDVIRNAAAEARDFTKEHFDILRKRQEPAGGGKDAFGQSVREAIEYADVRVTSLLPAVSALAEGSRTEGWRRKRPELLSLRAAVDRQLADALVAHAGSLRRVPGEPARRESLAALERAVSMLSADRLAPGDAAEVAVGIGSMLAEGKGRWEPFPGPAADEEEKGMISRVLPLLPLEAAPGAGGEEGLFLDAALRMRAKDPGARAAARRYLEKYPASPLSAGIGVRLGHEELLAGDVSRATARYRAVSDAGNPDASGTARYMLGWIRFQSGDSEGALEELSHPLSDPAFSCGAPSPFERAVVSLFVRAGRDASTARVESYPPVKEGTCVGKIILSSLWEAEEKRGETARAAAVRDIAARRFPSDANAAALEMETVEALLRTGQEEDAVSRALTLRGKYGPGSAWARLQEADVRDRTAKELGGMLKTLGERKFDEGLRTGGRAALSLSTAMLGEYLQLAGEKPTVDTGEIRLKRAIAFLGSGERKDGVRLLDELIEEDRKDATGERAGILYAETMIAGYERKEESAEDAEDAAFFILDEHPSEKAAGLALRASSAFLAAREYGRARSTAEEVEKSRFATVAQARDARLIQAEAAVFEGNLALARGKADQVLGIPGGAEDTGSAARAKDLFLLSSLKEIDGMAASGDPKGAAASLEGLTERFPEAQERPMYLLRAMRLYAQGGDGDGAIRAGSRFLQEFPRKEEAVDAAGVVGPLLEEKGESAKAGGLYEIVAAGFPKSESAPKLLFHAARLAEVHGPDGAASRRFASWRARYSTPVWMRAYATLYLGLDDWRGGERKASIRLMEEGLRKVDAGVEEEAPASLQEAVGKARIAVGENWAEQFRNTRLVVPLEKSLALKDRFFRNALAAFGKAAEDAPLEVALQADLLSGDLLIEYGKAILESQRPKGLKGADLEEYEDALRGRARSFFERSIEWCAGALDRLEKGKGPSDLAVLIRKRLETAQALLEGTTTAKKEEPGR